MKKDQPSEEVQQLLKQVVDHFDKEDRAVRERQIRQWKKLKYYWAGFQRLWWSEVAHDWRVFDVGMGDDLGQSQDASYYDKPVNIFRAYLESIIAALSVTVPAITCYPDDADNPQDIDTAKAGDKIADLLDKHNNLQLEWLHALFIYCTEGMVANYTYPKEDYEYGEYTENKYDDVEEEQDVATCPDCNTQIPPELLTLSNQLLDEFDKDEDNVETQDLLQEGHGVLCPQCMQIIQPHLAKEKLIVTKLVGTTTKPKTRICMETYGGLYVKVANYAMRQSDTPYLIFSYETHYSNVLERFPQLKDKFTGTSNVGPGSGGMYDPYERWGRLSTQYFGEYPNNTTTVRNCWLRPAAFNILNQEEDVDKLKKLYPNGVKVVYANDIFAEAENECLDDCWTITHNPLSDYIHFDPLGLLLTSVQEISNDLISLTIQTIEHGIPQTFADPGVVNFEQYRQMEATPGMLIPTKPQSGKTLGDAFYQVSTASLGAAVLPFGEKINELGQLVSGALPSLFGGASPNSSKTAAQYAMSRSQALQRLQTTWKMFNMWWKEIHGKAIPAYIKEVVEDEKIVDKDESGNFINVWIRKAELQGKIGSVELESSDELPTTWSQKKDVIMQLMNVGNPEVMAALTSPENIPLLKQAIGLDDFSIPGEDDRQKQYEEIQILMMSGPIPGGMSPNGQPSMMPSVEVEPLVDNHPLEADICKRWLVSSAGRLAKQENPQGYQNVLLHMKQHMDMMGVMAAPIQGPQSQSPGTQGPQQGSGSTGGKNNQKPLAAPLPQGASSATQSIQ